MIIRSKRPDTGFTILANTLLNDQRLSFKARGILAYILSKPDDWKTTAAALARVAPEGRDAILAGLTELEHEGYVIRTRIQDRAGRWKTVTTVYDHPQPACDEPCGEPASPKPEKPNSENPDAYKELITKDSENVSDITRESTWQVCGHCNGSRRDPDDLLPCPTCNGGGMINAGP